MCARDRHPVSAHRARGGVDRAIGRSPAQGEDARVAVDVYKRQEDWQRSKGSVGSVGSVAGDRQARLRSRSDGPGVVSAQQCGEVGVGGRSARLGDGLLHLSADQIVVCRAAHRPEDAHRHMGQRRLGQPRQGEGRRRVRVGGVMDDHPLRVGVDLGDCLLYTSRCV